MVPGTMLTPRFCSPVLGHTSCYLNDQGGEFYEASSWAYSFYAPHDMATVVSLAGGADTFIERLDAFFQYGYHDIGESFANSRPLRLTQFSAGDEPGFLPRA